MPSMPQTTDDHYELITELRQFILDTLPDATPVQVVRDTQNFAALPKDAITIAFLFDSEMDYSSTYYDPAEELAAVHNSVEARVQLSFYGEAAPKRSRIIAQLWRNFYACDRLQLCKPLYVQSRQRQPYINESNQYENRYILDLALQYNPVVTHTQDFAESAEIDIQPIPEGG